MTDEEIREKLTLLNGAKVAKILGVSIQFVHLMRTGKRPIPDKHREKIEGIFSK